MAGNSAEMKVKATMDNSDLKKKAKESKDALKDFAKVGEDAVSSLGSAFGVNTGKIEQMMSAVRGLGENLSKSGNTGAAALGNLLKGVNGLTAGIAGIGIGAAVAGFKMLKDEAENFKQTVAGANMELATTAYIDTYKQVIHDFNRDLGKGFAETESGWKKFWGTIGSTLKAGFTTGAFAAGAMPAEYGAQAIENYSKLMSEAKAKGAEAERLANEMYKTQREISDASVEWARMEREIAEQKRIAYDKTVDTKTQQEALAKATELINQRYGEEAELRKRLADLQFEYNGLAESSVADIDKANQLRIQEEATVGRMNNALRELSERQATVTANAQKEAQARKEAAEQAAKMAQSRADLQAWGQMAQNVSTIQTPTQATVQFPVTLAPAPESVLYLHDWWQTETLKLGKLGKLHVGLDPEDLTTIREDMVDISSELESILTSTFDVIGTSLGGLIGDLATGGDAWSNFSSTAISAFGDMAISVGKMAISTGTATLGIKAALESLNGYVAIAAGVALVALGTAVKTGLSNIAGGNYSAAGAVATSTGSYGSSYSGVGTSFDTRDITVNVRGSLRADGNQLLAVIENENTRRNHTT